MDNEELNFFGDHQGSLMNGEVRG